MFLPVQSSPRLKTTVSTLAGGKAGQLQQLSLAQPTTNVNMVGAPTLLFAAAPSMRWGTLTRRSLPAETNRSGRTATELAEDGFSILRPQPWTIFAAAMTRD